jgi:hypothetical protein
MTTMQITGSLLRASEDDRILTYLLAPFGEPGRTNLGKVTLNATSLTIPDDVTGLIVNQEHTPTVPVGKFARVEATDVGYEADVRFLGTRAGDDALTEAREGVRKGISVEVQNPVIRKGQMLAGVLSGAGVCVTPAYPSALLVAADAGVLDVEVEVKDVNVVLIDGVEYVLREDGTYAKKQPTEDKPPVDEAAAAAESETEMGNSLTAANAAAAGLGVTPRAKKGPETVGEFSRLLAKSYAKGGEEQMFAALVDIVHDDGDNDGDGLGEITSSSGWLGNVWQAAPYERQFIPLLAQGTLSSYRENGYRWATTPTVAPYPGNKADVPSTGLTATPVNFGTQRWANAADIDRRYVDFNDSDVIQSFIEFNVDSYKEVTDVDTAGKILAAASAGTWTTVAGVNPAISGLVKLTLQLLAARFKPSFAIMGLDIYEPLLYLKKDDVSAFLTESYGLQGGVFDNFTILPTSLPAYQNQVVVGDGRTLRYKELGGTPVQVRAERVDRGGQDIAVFGYSSFQQLKPGGVLKVDVVP